MKKKVIWGTNDPGVLQSGNVETGTDRVININVSGVEFVIKASTVKKHPEATLARVVAEHERRPTTEEDVEYMFDRDPDVARKVLQLYTTGQLHYPAQVCVTTFKNDLEFWGVPCQIATCCSANYQSALSDWETIERFKKSIEDEKAVIKQYVFGDGSGCRARLWYFLNYPLTSVAAKIYVTFLTSVILLSVALQSIEDTLSWNEYFETLDSLNMTEEEIDVLQFERINCPLITQGWLLSNPAKVWMRAIQLAAALILLVDAILHVACAKAPFKALSSFRSFIEYTCATPSFVAAMYYELTGITNYCNITLSSWLELASCLRILRVTHLCIFLRHYMPCRVLAFCIRQDLKNVFTLLIYIGMFVITMGTFVFIFDRVGLGQNYNTMFPNLTDAFWYVLITMTTVGYGDKYPLSHVGKLVGGMCALAGILLMATAVPLVSGYFYGVLNYASQVDVNLFKRAPTAKVTSVKVETSQKDTSETSA